MTNTKSTFVRKIKRMSRKAPVRIVAVVLMVALVMNVSSVVTLLPVFAGNNTATTVQGESPTSSVKNVICGLEEHTHSSDCHKRVLFLICETDHVHIDECYGIDYVLICSKEEHIHTAACYPDDPIEDQSAVVQSGQCGDNITYTLYENGLLELSGSGKMYNYDSFNNKAPWNSIKTSITKVQVNNKVTSIGSNAFYECSSLTSITIPDSVTSIGDYSFCLCSSLTSITIPDSVTSIGDCSFCRCSSLTSITIPDSVIFIGESAFFDCNSLTSITIPDYIRSIRDLTFNGCSSLTSITIPDSVASIGYQAFCLCSSLTSITIPDSVTSIGDQAFRDSGLTSITIPDSVTSIGVWAFYGCVRLTSITMPDSVTSIGEDSFLGCISLPSITIPNSVTTIGEHAFAHCNSLTSITIPNSVTSICDFAFYYCNHLTDVYYTGTQAEWQRISIGKCNYRLTDATIHYNYQATNPEEPTANWGDLTWSLEENGLLTISGNCRMPDAGASNEIPWDSQRSLIKDVKFEGNVESICFFAFGNCPNLKSIVIPESVTYIGEQAFARTAGLEDIFILGKNCEIYDNWSTLGGDAVIHGYNGSTAQTYAREKERDFALIDGLPAGIIGLSPAPNSFLFGDTIKVTFSSEIASIDSEQFNKMMLCKRDGVVYLPAQIFSSSDSNVSFRRNTMEISLKEMIDDGRLTQGQKFYLTLGSGLIKLKDGTDVSIDQKTWLLSMPVKEKNIDIRFSSDSKKAKSSNGTLYHTFHYNDEFFYYNNKEYHNDLAIMSLGLEFSSWSTAETNDRYTETLKNDEKNLRANNIIDAYEELGFTDASFYNYDLPLSCNDDKAAYSFAIKYIQDDQGNIDTLLAVPIRGAGYGAEWASNFRVGNQSNHNGFETAASDVFSNLKKYITDRRNAGRIKGNLKIWCTGFSRGSAIANIVGHKINQSNLILNQNLYAYTFATPRGFMVNGSFPDDNNIFNIVSANDMVPKLACEKWGFGRYGISKSLPEYTPKNVSSEFQMLTHEVFDVNDNYKVENGILDVLMNVAPTREAFYQDCQEYVVNQYSEGYSKHNGSMVGCLISGLVQSIEAKETDPDPIYDNPYKPLGRIMRLIDVFIDDPVAFAESLPDAGKLLTIGQCHYGEHYLSWLETGGTNGIKILTTSQYANLSNSEKKRIENSIISEFNNTYKRHVVACPVDVKVYDAQNNIVVKIVNNEILVDDLPCWVEGNVKYFYTIADQTYHIELTGNDTGTMDYTVEECNSESKVVRTVNHYDIDLVQGKTYTEDVYGGILNPDNLYELKSGDDFFEADFDSLKPEGTSHSITVVNGLALKSAAYKNESVELYCSIIQGKKFAYWKSDAGDNIFEDAKSEDTTFVMPNKDVTIEAVFIDEEADKPYITSVETVKLETVSGNKPSYPEKVNAILSNGDEIQVSVSWDDTSLGNYKKFGDFTVYGVIAESDEYDKKNAQAECVVSVVPDLDFTILGASIRLSEPYGIRFGIQLGKGGDYTNVKIVEYGTLMKPTQLLGDEELTLQTAKIQKIPSTVTYSETDAALVYTGVLINIPTTYFDTAVSGRGYFIYEDENGVNHTIYTDTVSMSFNDVVEAAYNKYSKLTNPTDAQKVVLQKLEKLRALSGNN